MTRINFEVEESHARYIDELVESTGLKTKVALFNTALSLFGWAVRERTLGKAICSRDIRTGDITEIEMPGLPALPSIEELPPTLRERLARTQRGQARARWATGTGTTTVRIASLNRAINEASFIATTAEQRKEIFDFAKAFGLEIKPEARKALVKLEMAE